jgi:hypothetical protein
LIKVVTLGGGLFLSLGLRPREGLNDFLVVILDSHYLTIVLQFGPIKNGYPGMNCPEFCFQGARSFFIRLKSGGLHRAMRVFVVQERFKNESTDPYFTFGG